MRNRISFQNVLTPRKCSNTLILQLMTNVNRFFRIFFTRLLVCICQVGNTKLTVWPQFAIGFFGASNRSEIFSSRPTCFSTALVE